MHKLKHLMAAICGLSLTVATSLAASADDSFYNQGTRLLMGGQPREALPYFNASIGKGTKFIASYINRGVCYSRLGYYQKAVEDYNAALKIDANDHTALMNRAQIYGLTRKYDLAVKDLDKVADQEYKTKNKNLAKTYFTRALMYHQGQKFPECSDDCRRVLAMTTAPVSMRRNADSLMKWCAVEIVVTQLAKIDVLIRNNDLAKADLEMEKVAKNKPESVLPKKNLAVFYALQAKIAYTRKQLDKAERACAEAIKLDGNNAKAHAVLGQICLERREFDSAGDHLSRAISGKERTIENYCARATVRLIQQRPDQALRDLNEALVLDPKDKRVLLLRGIASISDKSFNQLIAAGQEAIEKDGAQTDKGATGALLSYDAMLQAEKVEDADKMIDGCLLKTEKDKWSNNLYLFLKKKLDADALIKSAQNDNQRVDAHACVGLTALRSGDKVTAQKELDWCNENADANRFSWLLLSCELYDPHKVDDTVARATESSTPVSEKAGEAESDSDTPSLPPELSKSALQAELK